MPSMESHSYATELISAYVEQLFGRIGESDRLTLVEIRPPLENPWVLSHTLRVLCQIPQLSEKH